MVSRFDVLASILEVKSGYVGWKLDKAPFYDAEKYHQDFHKKNPDEYYTIYD